MNIDNINGYVYKSCYVEKYLKYFINNNYTIIESDINKVENINKLFDKTDDILLNNMKFCLSKKYTYFYNREKNIWHYVFKDVNDAIIFKMSF